MGDYDTRFYKPYKPPRIYGHVPDNYDGPIYYRVAQQYGKRIGNSPVGIEGHYDGPGAHKPPNNFIASVLYDMLEGYHVRSSPVLFDEQGGLRDLWKQPLSGVVSRKAPKKWPEFAYGISLVSERVHDIIERHEPGMHVFIPVDVSTDGNSLRQYVFINRGGSKHTMLARDGDMVGHRVFEKENGDFSLSAIPNYGAQYIAEKEEDYYFFYLRRNTVDDQKVFFITETYSDVFSPDVVDEMGDVLPPWMGFYPIGVKDELVEVGDVVI
ncbi:MAG: DUF1629 domain-containing protein [Pseudomonadota bacterium]